MQYNGALTREQFMFQEMRIAARLMWEGLSEAEIIDRVKDQNLFQYPTEREAASKCRACLKRLACIQDMPVIMDALIDGAYLEAKQAALIAMMCQNRLMAEFMVQVIGHKYRTLDLTVTAKDFHMFFQDLAAQDETVASWTDSTIAKIKSVIRKCLKEAEFISGEQLLPVYLSPDFVQALKSAGHRDFLCAFNVLDE